MSNAIKDSEMLEPLGETMARVSCIHHDGVGSMPVREAVAKMTTTGHPLCESCANRVLRLERGVRGEAPEGAEDDGRGERGCLCVGLSNPGKEHPDCPVPGHGIPETERRDDDDADEDEDHKEFWSGVTDGLIAQTLRSWANGRRAAPPEPRLRDALFEAADRLERAPTHSDADPSGVEKYDANGLSGALARAAQEFENARKMAKRHDEPANAVAFSHAKKAAIGSIILWGNEKAIPDHLRRTEDAGEEVEGRE